ncbi:hypothetical protein ACSAZL_08020 [Methanosarcina sp. T3]|uniref:hypothetical protein n=1 Tax=Methanosarcina sp. T3 TaxID=3439062 RepID=UPI003F848123
MVKCGCNMRSIYFHEDDYCQLEILPVQNYNYCKKEINNILNFSEEHKADNGIGWTDMYVRDENPTTLTELRISVSKLCSSLQNISCKFDIVYTGYGSHREVCQNTLAYGDSDDVVIFFDSDKEKSIIKNMWLTLDVHDEHHKESAQKIFCTLSKFSDFILVDWSWGFISELSSTIRLENYLNERIKCFSSY